MRPPLPDSTATALAASIGLPPPMATSTSQPLSRYCSKPAATSVSLGFAVSPDQTCQDTPAAARCGRARSAQPAASTPGAVDDERGRPAGAAHRVADFRQAADAEDGFRDEELLEPVFHGRHLCDQRNRGPDICQLVQTS